MNCWPSAGCISWQRTRTTRRRGPPKMSEARRVVEKKYGMEYARALCDDNPLAAFEGRPLPEQDEAEDLYEDKKKEKGWVARLLGR